MINMSMMGANALHRRHSFPLPTQNPGALAKAPKSGDSKPVPVAAYAAGKADKPIPLSTPLKPAQAPTHTSPKHTFYTFGSLESVQSANEGVDVTA